MTTQHYHFVYSKPRIAYFNFITMLSIRYNIVRKIVNNVSNKMSSGLRRRHWSMLLLMERC